MGCVHLHTWICERLRSERKDFKTEQEKTDKYVPLVAETISNEHQWKLKTLQSRKNYLKEIIVFLIIEYERNPFIASPAPISKTLSHSNNRLLSSVMYYSAWDFKNSFSHQQNEGNNFRVFPIIQHGISLLVHVFAWNFSLLLLNTWF